MKPLRYPDVPGNVISRKALDLPGGEGLWWFATLKMDGWRCVANCTDGIVTYWSKKLLPLEVKPQIAEPFEKDCKDVLGGNWTLDCELTGNRRAGDAARIYILSLLRNGDSHNPDSIVAGAGCRWSSFDLWHQVHAQLPQYTVNGVCTNFGHFFDDNQDDPLAEGIVLMRKGMKYIGNTSANAANPGMVKAKWRAGMSGTTWNATTT